MRNSDIFKIVIGFVFFALGFQFGISVSGSQSTENKQLQAEVESLKKQLKTKDEALDFMLKGMYMSGQKSISEQLDY